MTNQQLEQYLHQHIPLSAAMQVTVKEITATTLTLQAPLTPNINHQETVFGGSASTLAILAAWSLLHTRLTREGVVFHLVIRRNEMAYLKPMRTDFSAIATLVDEDDWPQFLNMLQLKGKARIRVAAVLSDGDQPAGQFLGEYVALSDRQ
ncbi:thioesterase domain-containing protein [Methylophaga pinxianii]|uniref:thioesterase domain-containing protein n=2 Tax=Methylophaga pinxianii TaxID=2881052 RepID=UPI001CF2D209|nr:thioesterase domain-containing protein [Methylophaga pinxianii]UPH46825.1 thioesterase domain-containing protein [Methylophaga pinxianii]